MMPGDRELVQVQSSFQRTIVQPGATYSSRVHISVPGVEFRFFVINSVRFPVCARVLLCSAFSALCLVFISSIWGRCVSLCVYSVSLYMWLCFRMWTYTLNVCLVSSNPTTRRRWLKRWDRYESNGDDPFTIGSSKLDESIYALWQKGTVFWMCTILFSVFHAPFSFGFTTGKVMRQQRSSPKCKCLFIAILHCKSTSI